MTIETSKRNGSVSAVDDLTDKYSDDKLIATTATLYNFGYAPKKVIECFQTFCYNYNTLSEAINALLKRDKLLTKKYRFMVVPVTYQMLARPTNDDHPNVVRNSLLLLHKYSKECHYKSVSDAIEELLLSPSLPNKGRPISKTNSENLDDSPETTILTDVEKDALIKIADVLYLKLQQKCSQNRAKARRTGGTKKTSPGKQTSGVAIKPNASKTANPTTQVDPDYTPDMGDVLTVWTKPVKSILRTGARLDSAKLCKTEPQAMVSKPDSQLIVPLHTYTSSYCRPKLQSETQIENAMHGVDQSERIVYMHKMLKLIPSEISTDKLFS